MWKAFARSKSVRIICFALAAALLVVSGVGVWRSFSAPGEVELPQANYEHKGQFDYLVYLKPNTLYGEFIPPEEKEAEETEAEETEPAEETPLIFFRDILDDVQLAFSYKFDCSEPTASVSNDVVVTITAENPGMWQYEMKQLEKTCRGKEFRVDFPLHLDSLDHVVDKIEDDIGITTTQREFIIKAVINTTALTVSGLTIEDEFSHEITAILKEKTLELVGDLRSTDTSSEDEVKYEQEGWFDYEAYLKYNKLYESGMLRSEPLPVAPAPEPPTPPSTPLPLQKLGPGLVYFTRIIDSVKASFSYQFDCDKPLSEQSEEVEITAIIENPDKWSKSIVLVPKTRETGDFTISFPVDLDYFNEVIDAIEEETGASGSSYNLKIQANVHTNAKTGLGAINEVYGQILEGKLEGNILTFGEELSQSQLGFIGGGVVTPTAPEEGGWKMPWLGGLSVPWLGGLVVALLALGYLGWNQARLKLAGISAADIQAARAKKKYKQVLVDIEELPKVKPNEIVIPLNSLDDLVRIADDLVKPVLHQVEEGRHIYCTIDGAVRYQYVIPG